MPIFEVILLSIGRLDSVSRSGYLPMTDMDVDRQGSNKDLTSHRSDKISAVPPRYVTAPKASQVLLWFYALVAQLTS